jgi:hypothetical protein
MARSNSALLRAVPKTPDPRPSGEEIQAALARARVGLVALTGELEEARLGAPLLRQFEDALAEIEHAERALDEQIVLERIERQQLRVHLQSLDLLRFASEVARAAAPRCRRERKPLCQEAEGSVLVMADADLLQRAIQALLDCALAHGLPNKPVVLDVEEEEQRVRLTFIAQGCEENKKSCPCGEHLVGVEPRLAFARRLAAAQSGEIELTRAFGLGVCYALVLPKGVPAAQGLPTLPSGEVQVVEE